MLLGWYYPFGVDGGWWSVVRGGRAAGIAGQSEGHATSSIAESWEATGPVAGQSVESKRNGWQGECARGGDDVLVSRDEDSIGLVVETSHRPGKRVTCLSAW